MRSSSQRTEIIVLTHEYLTKLKCLCSDLSNYPLHCFLWGYMKPWIYNSPSTQNIYPAIIPELCWHEEIEWSYFSERYYPLLSSDCCICFINHFSIYVIRHIRTSSFFGSRIRRFFSIERKNHWCTAGVRMHDLWSTQKTTTGRLTTNLTAYNKS